MLRFCEFATEKCDVIFFRDSSAWSESPEGARGKKSRAV
jgi:hypothetical protein